MQKMLTITLSIKIAGQTLKIFTLLKIQKTYTKRLNDPTKTVLLHFNPPLLKYIIMLYKYN